MTITPDGTTWTPGRDGTFIPSRVPTSPGSRRGSSGDNVLVLDPGEAVPPGTPPGTVILVRAPDAPVLVLNALDPVPGTALVGTVILRRP